MPPAEDVQRYLSGVWRLMRGRPDGLLLLDLTADGFWNSFAAFFYAAPALFLDLVVLQHYYVVWDLSGFADRVLVIALLALIHIAGWLLPVLVFALVARPAGLEQRFVAFVVARNWGMVITA